MQSEEAKLVAKGLLSFHTLATGVHASGLYDKPSLWHRIVLSPHFLLAVGFGAVVFGARK